MKVEECISIVSSLDHPSEYRAIKSDKVMDLRESKSALVIYNEPLTLVRFSHPIIHIRNFTSAVTYVTESKVSNLDNLKLHNINSLIYLGNTPLKINRLEVAISDPYLIESKSVTSLYRKYRRLMNEIEYEFNDVTLNYNSKLEVIKGELNVISK